MATTYENTAWDVMTALRRGHNLTRTQQRRVLTLAKSLLDSNDPQLARVLLRLLRKMEPYEARICWLLGLCEFQLGNYVQAERCLESHWHLTRRPQTSFILARLYFVMGDVERSGDYLRHIPPYERYLVGNSPLFHLLLDATNPKRNSVNSDDVEKDIPMVDHFGPFFNETERAAIAKVLGRQLWKRGLVRLQRAEFSQAINDFESSKKFLNSTHTGGAHV
jgi:tetratricopeptide (TPR) repeat protein